MSPLVWIVVGLAALGLVAWTYGGREERVPGRAGPAVLRIAALVLVLGGLALPALGGGTVGPPATVALIDVSRSMALAVRPDDPEAPARLDSARLELRGLSPDRLYAFGDEPRALPVDSAPALRAADGRTRLTPALAAADLGGADSVWVLTDGAWEDRAEALALARDLGLGLREIRLAAEVPRAGLADVRAPARAPAGDTVRIAAELRATGSAGDSVTVELRLDGEVLTGVRVPRPTPGRTVTAELELVPEAPSEDSEWRRYEVTLGADADPYGAADAGAVWIEISEASTGAVFVSTTPDWEARHSVPSLERLVLGGSRGFLRLEDDRYLEMGARPRLVDASLVRAALRGARLLVVQGAPGELPPWLAVALRTHPRTLLLATGPGEMPGAGVRLTGPLPGEWYPTPPIPSSPATAALADVDLASLPPVRRMLAADPAGDWSALNASRDRRGEARPVLVAGRDGEVRWAVATGSELWRWAARAGPPRRVYDGILAGVVGWLIEESIAQLVALDGTPAPGRPLEWRVRPDAEELGIVVTDSAGAEVWAGDWPDPESRITGPPLPAGSYELALTAEGPDGPFRVRRPLEIRADPRELLPRPAGDPADVAPVVTDRSGIEARAPRPVWPFAVAIVLLCVEWIWRHRIGLR